MKRNRLIASILAAVAGSWATHAGSYPITNSSENTGKWWDRYLASLPKPDNRFGTVMWPRYSRRHGRKLSPNAAQRRRLQTAFAS